MASRTRFSLLSVLPSVLVAGSLLVGPEAATAADSGGTTEGAICMQRVFMGPTPTTVTTSNQVNCTASDVRVARAISAKNLDTGGTSCNQGSSFTLQATFEVDVTANIRYDEGFFFRIDGGTNARGDGPNATGTCSLSWLNPAGTPGMQLDGDACGDLTSGTYNNVTYTIPNVSCTDDGTGHVRLPNCVSWHSNQGTVCTPPPPSANDFTFKPDTKSKCTCDDTFSIPITVQKAGMTLDKSASPTQVPEGPTGGPVSYTVDVTNSSTCSPTPCTAATVTFTGLNDNVYGDLTKIAGSTCAVPQTLAPGASYSCTFSATVAGLDEGQSLSDTVCTTGATDQSGNPVTNPCGSASVSATDVQPTAAVVKTVEKAVCATVRYDVQVDNTNPAGEALQLTALSDSPNGDITKVQGTVTATTCSVPQSIAYNGNYKCTFDALVCSFVANDTVTATLTDVDGHTINPTGSATVNGVTLCTSGGSCPATQ